MNKLQILAKDRRSIAIALGCVLALTLFTSSSNTESATTQSVDVRVRSHSKAFEVVGSDREGDNLAVRLKNVSNKTIDGYALRLPGGGQMLVDYTTSGRFIAPGAVESQLVPLSEPAASGGAESGPPEVTLISVTFTDYSSDGEHAAATYIMERRLGVKRQLKHILPLMKSAAAASDANLSADLTRLKSQLTGLAEQADGASQAVRDGLLDAKQDALKSLERMEQKQQAGKVAGAKALREELRRELADHEKRAARQ